MSQLNPNAAEFVPVSPTRSIPSPACRALLNDEVLAQSPKRPVRVDIKVPNEVEFEKEVKSRPSDFDMYSNGHGSDSEHNISGTEQIENILNGKSIDEIPEFQPGSTPAKQPPAEEFHFGPNAAPFTPRPLDQSEALSTRANYGDDTEQTLNTSFNDSELAIPHKDSGDPMSMSFSEERGELNPFQDGEDLNKVHDLPDNLDKFLEEVDVDKNKENVTFDDTISDLPEHDVLGHLDNDQATIQTTDLDKLSQEDEKELASPLEPELDFLEAEKNITSKTPDLLESTELTSAVKIEGLGVAPILELEQELSDSRLSPLPGQLDLRQQEVQSVSPTPEVADLLQSKSPVPNQPEPEKQETILLDVVDRQFKASDVLGGLESQGPVCEFTSGMKSPFDDFVESKSPVCELKPTSDMFETEFNPKSEVEHVVLEAKSLGLSEAVLACEYSADPAVCELRPRSAEAVPESHSPFDPLQEQKQDDDITSSVKDDISSPIELLSPVKSPEPLAEESFTGDHIKQGGLGSVIIEDSFVNQEEHKTEISSQDLLLTCPMPPSHQQLINDPLVQVNEINMFEASAPLEPSRFTELSNGFSNFASDFTEQFSIKTDSIKPEFAEPAVITPSEDSKVIDEVPVVPLAEVPAQELPKVEVKPVELTETSQEAPKELPVLAPLPIIAVTPKETKEVKKEEKKSSSSAPIKRPTGKVTPSKSATTATKTSTAPKPPAPRVSPKTGVAPRIPSKTAPAKPATTGVKTTTSAPTATKPSPKPKTAAPAPKPIERKPLLNGDVKPAPRTTLTKRSPGEVLATKTTTRPATTTAAKTSPTKTATARPATAPRTAPPKPSATAPKAPISATLAAKPRVPLASRTTTTGGATSRLVTSTTTTRTTTTTATNRTSPSPKTSTAPPKTSTVPPKPKTISYTAPKPRPPITKTITKSADVEKEKKESANKLTASRTTTITKTTSGTATNRTATTTLKKTETKPLSHRPAVPKTTTTTTRTTTLSKKPGEIKSVTKTKTTKVEKPKENGIAPTNITEEIKEITIVNNIVNETENLLKDNSPLDNKLITETNALIDVNPAAD